MDAQSTVRAKQSSGSSTSALELLRVQIPREYCRSHPCPALPGWGHTTLHAVTRYKCTHTNNHSDTDVPRATRQPDTSQAHCSRWWEARMLGSGSRAWKTLGKKYFLSLRPAVKHSRKETQNSYTGCTLATPLLQTILVAQHGTQLSSNICMFLVAKIENFVKTSHYCALIENDWHLLYFVQDMCVFWCLVSW